MFSRPSIAVCPGALFQSSDKLHVSTVVGCPMQALVVGLCLDAFCGPGFSVVA